MLTSCSMPGSVLNNLNEISRVNPPTQQDKNHSEPVLEVRTSSSESYVPKTLGSMDAPGAIAEWDLACISWPENSLDLRHLKGTCTGINTYIKHFICF